MRHVQAVNDKLQMRRLVYAILHAILGHDYKRVCAPDVLRTRVPVVPGSE